MKRLAFAAVIAIAVLASLYAATRAQESRREALQVVEKLKAEAERFERDGQSEKARRAWTQAEEALEQLEPREVDEDAGDFDRRIDHLREAAEHLEAAGKREWSEEAFRQAEQWQREFEARRDEGDADEPRGKEQYEEAMGVLREILEVVQDLRGEIGELREEVGDIRASLAEHVEGD